MAIHLRVASRWCLLAVDEKHFDLVEIVPSIFNSTPSGHTRQVNDFII